MTEDSECVHETDMILHLQGKDVRRVPLRIGIRDRVRASRTGLLWSARIRRTRGPPRQQLTTRHAFNLSGQKTRQRTIQGQELRDPSGQASRLEESNGRRLRAYRDAASHRATPAPPLCTLSEAAPSVRSCDLPACTIRIGPRGHGVVAVFASEPPGPGGGAAGCSAVSSTGSTGFACPC
jgi:hypothetical protein